MASIRQNLNSAAEPCWEGLDLVSLKCNSPRVNAPKGDCYKAAYQAIEELAELADAALDETSDWDLREATLVHGHITPSTGPAAGKEIGHAWVEISNQVFELSNGNKVHVSKDTWQHEVSAKPGARYSFREARSLAEAYGHYGPWPERR